MRIHHHSQKEAKATQEVAFKVEIIIINTPSAVGLRQRWPQENSESKLIYYLFLVYPPVLPCEPIRIVSSEFSDSFSC